METQQWSQDWKRSVFIPIPKKGNPKECSNYCTIALVSHSRKVMLKVLQARVQQYMNWYLPDVQTGFRKDKGTRDQITNIHFIIEKENSRKTSTFASLTMLKPLRVWITTNCGKFFKRWEHQTTWPASWEICMQVKKQQLELDMEQQTGSKLGKEYVKVVYCHPVCLTYIYAKCWTGWSTSCNQDCGRNINNLRYTDVTTLLAESEEKPKSLMMKVKEKSEEAGLKLTFKNWRLWHLDPSLRGK